APVRPRRPVAAARRLAPPRPTPAPARAAEPASAHMRAFAAKGFSIAAMAFVALMAVSTSLPAEALLSSADVQAAALAASRPNDSGPAQSLDLAGGTDTITVERDGYDSQTIAEVAAASGIRLEATFTNDPNGTIQWPFAVGVHIGSRFGIRHCAGCSVNHQGQDFNPGIGAPIQAIADGVVSQAIDGEGSLGVHMVIDHMINGKLVSSAYAHMIHGSMLFKVGDVVKVGQVIGKTGNTGMSTGPHLHFEIRLGGLNGTHVDPLVWLYANTN
ncbi:MAG TPA: M23 family metallopeptidase, partial [Cryobacterium sp.]|nr:M23 family metallopeptidase [Cryobacterium sp.]